MALAIFNIVKTITLSVGAICTVEREREIDR